MNALLRVGYLFSLLLATTPVVAQQPLPIGTGVGAGLGAMTESRLSEAATWNPALAAIFDGPMTSMSAFGTHVEPGAMRAAYDIGRLGWRLFGEPVSVMTARDQGALLRWRSGGGVSRMRAEGAIQWLGLHSRDLLINLASYAYVDLNAPDHVLATMAGDAAGTVPAPSTQDIANAAKLESHRALASVLSIAKGSDLGLLPYLGRSWVGVTAKAAFVHDHALGRFGYADPELVIYDSDGVLLSPDAVVAPNEVAGLYSEVGVHGARIFGVDVGIVSNPTPPLVISLAIVNIFQKASLRIGSEDLYGRGVAFVGRDSAGNGRAFAVRHPLDLTESQRPWLADAEFLARGTHFTPVARLGTSIDTRSGRFIGGVSVPLERQYAMDRAALDEYSFGWQFTGHPLRPRVAYTRRLDGASGVFVGVHRGFCTDRLALGAGYVERPQGRTLSLSASWSRGSGLCGQFR